MRGHETTHGVRADEELPASPDVDVTAHRSSPDRIVFTEEGNNDGWIATDMTVSLER